MKLYGPGTVVGGRYRIVRRLGRGSTALVFEVVCEGVHERLALKLLKSEMLDDPKAERRLEREAIAGVAIESEHVVRAIATGVDEGTPWLVMQYVDGEDLAALVAARGALARGEARVLLGQLFAGVARAHEEGIVHRDLKPEHVMVEGAGGSTDRWRIRILDFGIAKLISPDGRATGTRAGLGTPLWTAPEQASAGYVPSPANDVWALGLIVFFVLTGQSYWVSAGRAGSTMDLLIEIMRRPIVAPTARAKELGCEERVPAALDAWFLRAVARDPAARFRSAGEARGPLLDALG